MFSWILSKIIGFATSGVIDKALDFYNRSQDSTVKIKGYETEQVKAAMSAYVSHTKIMADLNAKKMENPIFWILISLFVVPLGVWWALVIGDSIFNWPFQIADLPTKNMQDWAGNMIQWLFYCGTGVAGIKMLMSK